eukprot:350626-Amphidinium_carterae.1
MYSPLARKTEPEKFGQGLSSAPNVSPKKLLFSTNSFFWGDPLLTLPNGYGTWKRPDGEPLGGRSQISQQVQVGLHGMSTQEVRCDPPLSQAFNQTTIGTTRPIPLCVRLRI